MKPYTLFSLIYLGVFLGCIVFQIESWPFSDFGVYKYSAHPRDLQSYRLGFQTESGGREWLFQGKEAIYNKSIQDVFELIGENKREAFVLSLAREARRRAKGSQSKLTMFEIGLDETDDGFRPRIAPYLEVPLK